MLYNFIWKKLYISPQVSGILLAIVLRLALALYFQQETLAQTESELGDLKKNLSGQQDARAKSEEKYQLALAELEKLKAELKRAQADQDASIKRAEKAEARLATVQQELSGLKRHISNMTQAVFGKLTQTFDLLFFFYK